MPDQITAPDFDVRRPFLRADALAAGIPERMLRGAKFRRIFRGVLVSAATRPTPTQRAQAALAPFAKEKSYLSHASAARIHQVPIPTLSNEHVSVVAAKHRLKRAGITVHVARAGEVVTREGMLVSTHRQMFVELANILDLVDLVVVGDNLVRSGRVTLQQLIEHCTDSVLPHTAAALRAAKLVRAGVDSPMETRLRLLIVLAGLPEPTVNFEIRTHHGHKIWAFDLCYPAIRVGLEYDGSKFHDPDDDRHADNRRHRSLEDLKWHHRSFRAPDIYKSPGDTVAEIFALLQRHRLPGLPAQPDDAWRAHFPGH